MSALSRRRFLQLSASTVTALSLGPRHWGWAGSGSPFGGLQDDPILRLPEGFSYKILAQTGDPLQGGRGPATRPQFPDLNVAFRQPNGRILLSTSHEIPSEFPGGQPPPQEEYDQVATGAITSLLLDGDLNVVESAYNAGGMINNCSGGRTPWGTVLTGEESTATLEADHGFIWEVDPHKNTKVRLDACGRFEHEAALIDGVTGYVYLTEDSGDDSLLYRLKPKVRTDLARGGVLQAYKAGGKWVTIDDPIAEGGVDPSAQGIEKGALPFARLEGARIRARWLYFTETEDDTACGKIWRLHLDKGLLELWAEGSEGGPLCMPDNMAFDAVRNMYVCEDKGAASTSNPNHIHFIDRKTGEMAVFAEVVQQNQTPGVNIADEPTGTYFARDHSILFLNLQRANGGGYTLGITGPFAEQRGAAALADAAAPSKALATEVRYLRRERIEVPGMSVLEAAAWLRLVRLGRIVDVPRELGGLASEFPAPARVASPRVRVPKPQ